MTGLERRHHDDPHLHGNVRRSAASRNQNRAAKTVKAFGWLLLVEGLAILVMPDSVAALLQLVPLSDHSHWRIIDWWRRHALCRQWAPHREWLYIRRPDRSPPDATDHGIALVSWAGAGNLAAAFSLLDFGNFLWTLSAWRADQRAIATV